MNTQYIEKQSRHININGQWVSMRCSKWGQSYSVSFFAYGEFLGGSNDTSFRRAYSRAYRQAGLNS